MVTGAPQRLTDKRVSRVITRPPIATMASLLPFIENSARADQQLKQRYFRLCRIRMLQ
jgi:hypothetical protein